MKARVTMRHALEDPDIFGTILAGESWNAWRILLIAAMGEALTDDERTIFTELTGRPQEPLQRVDELWCVIGRRGGKTRAIAVLAAYIAALVDWSDILAPGERASLPVMSASTWQAGKCMQYLRGIFTDVPIFAALVENQTAETIALSTRVDIEVRPANFRTARGGTCTSVICDEISMWRNDNSANPDKEILDALRPSLATTGGMIAAIGSPYARKGEQYQAYKRHFGPNGDPAILIAKAPSRTMNPSLSEAVVKRAYERDPASAAAEYGAEFRSDLESFVSIEAVEACVDSGCYERPWIPRQPFVAFVDAAGGGGGGDSMTIAIAHGETRNGVLVGVLDALRERTPPFSPDDVVAEFLALLKSYRISTVIGDRWGSGFVQEGFTKQGVKYIVSAKPRSDLYKELLPAINSQRVSLLDHQKMINQLCNLERRTARGGRDSIDHPQDKQSHDDLINAAAGALVAVLEKTRRPPMRIPDELMSWASTPDGQDRRHLGPYDVPRAF